MSLFRRKRDDWQKAVRNAARRKPPGHIRCMPEFPGNSVFRRATSIPVQRLFSGKGGTVLLEDRKSSSGSKQGASSREKSRSGKTSPSPPHASVEKDVGMSLWKRLKRILVMKPERLLTGSGPLKWPGKLLPFQIDGVNALLSRKNILLADDMGLGKTIQAIAALRIMFVQRQVNSALLIVPAGLIYQWQREIMAWAPELRVSVIKGVPEDRSLQWRVPAHIYIVSYETFRSDFVKDSPTPPGSVSWDVVLLDEAQKIKNPKTAISRAVKDMKRTRAWSLTGTPLENSMDDLVSIMEFTTLRSDDPSSRLWTDDTLLELHQKTQLRRKKSDVLKQLPGITVKRLFIPLGDAQRESYDMAEKEGIIELKEHGGKIPIVNILQLIMRLKQICNFCPRTGESAKLADIENRLRVLKGEGHRALLFSQFTDSRFGCRHIARRLEKFNPLVFTGDLSSQQKDRILQQFRSNPHRTVLILSLRAGGQGLNLQEASYVFHFDRWWNPAIEKQANARSHRMGQTNPVHIYQYTLQDTIEERIEAILRKKQLLFDEMVDDVTLDLQEVLTHKELLGLFGLE